MTLNKNKPSVYPWQESQKDITESLTQECHKRKLGVTEDDNIYALRLCSLSVLHMNWKGENILIKNILFYLNKFCSNWLLSESL